MAGETVVSMRHGRVIPKQSIYEASSAANHTVGDSIMLPDGRVFYYAYNGGTALAPCKNNQASAIVTTGRVNLACPTGSVIGSTYVWITTTTAVLTVNEYAGGMLHIDTGTDPFGMRIKSHTVQAAVGDIKIHLFDPIPVATTTSSKVSITKNPWSGVVVYPLTETGIPAGVNLITVPINNYFWCQTWGPVPCLTDGVIVVGQHVRVSDGVVGAVEALNRDGTDENEPQIGYVMRVNATATYSLIFLQIAP